MSFVPGHRRRSRSSRRRPPADRHAPALGRITIVALLVGLAAGCTPSAARVGSADPSAEADAATTLGSSGSPADVAVGDHARAALRAAADRSVVALDWRRDVQIGGRWEPVELGRSVIDRSVDYANTWVRPVTPVDDEAARAGLAGGQSGWHAVRRGEVGRFQQVETLLLSGRRADEWLAVESVEGPVSSVLLDPLSALAAARGPSVVHGGRRSTTGSSILLRSASSDEARDLARRVHGPRDGSPAAVDTADVVLRFDPSGVLGEVVVRFGTAAGTSWRVWWGITTPSPDEVGWWPDEERGGAQPMAPRNRASSTTTRVM